MNFVPIIHKAVFNGFPFRVNTALNENLEFHKIAITCFCGTQYKFHINGRKDALELTEENAPVLCPFCGQHCSANSGLIWSIGQGGFVSE